MKFQILDENQKNIKFNILDKEICELWGEPIDEKWYACPPPENDSFQAKFDRMNWFDYFGWKIQEEKINSFDEMENSMLSPFKSIFENLNITDKNEQIKELKENSHKMKYMFQVLDMWKEKNYTIKSLEN